MTDQKIFICTFNIIMSGNNYRYRHPCCTHFYNSCCHNHKPKCDPIIINLYIRSVNPPGGPISGNNSVVIIGDGFNSVKTINFGTIKITTFTLINNNEISFTVPAMSSDNNINISVSTSNFTSNIVCYTYIAQPIITSIIPSSGPIGGGNNVTINGTDLTSTVNINFGSSTINNFMVIDNSTISFMAPASGLPATNTVNVIVNTLGGNSNILVYQYVLPPVI